jgi:hypothetical protein
MLAVFGRDAFVPAKFQPVLSASATYWGHGLRYQLDAHGGLRYKFRTL